MNMTNLLISTMFNSMNKAGSPVMTVYNADQKQVTLETNY